MKEHPIIFSVEMARAIIEGRKTQTRRVCTHLYDGSWCLDPEDSDEDRAKLIEACPYGARGDRLWAKEAWTLVSPESIGDEKWYAIRNGLRPYTNHPDGNHEDGYALAIFKADSSDSMGAKWRSSRFMPRWASRITLEIVNVRAERVGSISREDIEAEGTPPNPTDQMSYRNDYFQRWRDFAWLWNSINAERGYGLDANPWVWVIEFKRVNVSDSGMSSEKP